MTSAKQPENSGRSRIHNIPREEILRRLIQKERGYYLACLELLESQRQALINGRPFSEISPLLRKQQILLECIDDLEKALIPIKKSWKAKSSHEDPTSIEVRKELADLQLLLQDLLAKDKENQRLFNESLSSLKNSSGSAKTNPLSK